MNTVLKYFILCIGLFLFAPQWVYSQNYIKEISTPQDDMFGNKYRLNDSILLTTYAYGNYDYGGDVLGKYDVKLIAINTRTGEISDKVVLPGMVSDNYVNEYYKIFNDTLHQRYILCALGMSDSKNKDTLKPVRLLFDYSTIIVHLNYDYEVIFDTMIFNQELTYWPYRKCLTSDGNLLISYVNDISNNIWELWKTDIYGNILQAKEYQRYYPSKVLDIPGQEKYVVFGSHLEGGTGPALYFLNKNTLEIDGLTPVVDDIDGGIQVMNVTYHPAHNALLYLMVVDINAVTWDTTTLAHPYLSDYHIPLLQNSINSERRNIRWTNDGVYLGTIVPGHFFDFGGIFNKESVIVLQRFNMQGDILWSRSYMSTADGYRYHTTDICPDANGDMIVFARRYKIYGQAERDIIYFKVDKETGNMIEWEQ